LLQKEREFEAARRMTQVLFEHLHLAALVEKTLTTVPEVVGAESGSLLLANQGFQELVFRYSLPRDAGGSAEVGGLYWPLVGAYQFYFVFGWDCRWTGFGNFMLHVNKRVLCVLMSLPSGLSGDILHDDGLLNFHRELCG